MIESLAFNDDEAEWAVGMQALGDTLTQDWSVKCRGCRWARRYGSGQDSARRAARKHARDREHNAELRNQGVMVELVRHRAQQELPMSPPF